MSQTPFHIRAEPGDHSLRWRAGLFCFGVVLVFSLLSWRLIHLQCDRHEHFRAVIEETHHRTLPLNAWRGDIQDTRGRVLAQDEPVQQVNFDLSFLQHGTPLAKSLEIAEGMKANDLRNALSLEELQNRYLKHIRQLAAPVLGMTGEDFEDRVRKRYTVRKTGELVMGRDIGVSAALQLREDLEKAGLGTYREKSGKIGGLMFQNSYARRYPPDISLTHIVGLFGETLPAPGETPKPPRGVAGVERFFNSQLTGQPGSLEIEVDGWNNEIPAYRGKVTPPRNGRGIRLSLDLGLQGVLEQALDETGDKANEVFVGDLGAERVIVVLFDPVTMGVRAIGCRDRKNGPQRPMLSNPVSDVVYEPGSTIKIVTVAGALSSGKVNINSQISISSSGVYDDEDITPITDTRREASLSVEGILIHSSNIGAYKLARMQGTRRFEELIRDFGFCRATGFESPHESSGYLGDTMTLQTLSRVAFGNAIAVTPAQMCGALGAIINDGQYRPMHLAESWLDDKGQAVEGLPRAEPRRVITENAARAVQSAMVQVVERGTGKAARSELFRIAGKTGTARKAVPVKGKDGKTRSLYQGDVICSFIGFLPADKPRLGGLVIVDSPRGTKHSHSGGSMAGPLFRRIAERAMAYYEVPSQFSPEVKLLPPTAISTPVRGRGTSLIP